MHFPWTARRPALAVAAAAMGAAARPQLLPGGAAGALALGRRQASVKAQGAYKKKSKRGIPKKLGAKRTGGACTIPPPPAAAAAR